MRTSLQLLCGAVLLIAAVAVRADQPGEDDADAQVLARWLVSCEPDEQRVYVSVRIFADGTVEYVGGEQAHEVGERSTRIRPHEARYLSSRAIDFIRAPAASRQPLRHGTKPVAGMEFETRVDGRTQVRRESIETRASKVFANDVARKVPLLSWVCPAREESGDSGLSLAPFCAQWPKGVPRSH